MSWAASPWAVAALFLLAFSESSFFPIPPDVLLIAMALSDPDRALWFAFVCSVGSVLGGCFGYAIGAFAKEAVVDRLVRWMRWESLFERARAMYDRYDVWAVGIAGFTPIPYKIFTIAGGIARLNFIRFLAASAASRSARFFLVAGIIYLFGPQVKGFIDRYFNLLTILFVVLLVGGFVLLHLGWKRRSEKKLQPKVGAVEGMTTDELAAKVAAMYALQYLRDRGTTPSQDTVMRWGAKLTALSESELLQLGSDLQELKKFLG